MQSQDLDYQKYLKYKNKYLNLSSQTGGDMRSIRPTIYPDGFIDITTTGPPDPARLINLIVIEYNRKWKKKYDNTDYIISYFTNKDFNAIHFGSLDLYLNDLYTLLSQNTYQFSHIPKLFMKDFLFSNKNIYTLFNFIALFENIEFLNIEASNFDNNIVAKLLDIIRTNKSKNKLKFLKSIRFDFEKNKIYLKTQKVMVEGFKAIGIDLTYSKVHRINYRVYFNQVKKSSNNIK